MRYLYSLCFLVTMSCAAREGAFPERKDFGPFAISLPAHWSVEKVEGIDSYVKEIIAGQGDTIHFDYGYYSNSLEEPDSRVYPNSLINWFLERNIDTSGMYFIDKETVLASDREEYQIQKTCYETIDGYKAKIVEPKVSGIGLTGVYFDSLGHGEMGIVKLQISGRNLGPKNNALFLKAIRTIKIKKINSKDQEH